MSDEANLSAFVGGLLIFQFLVCIAAVIIVPRNRKPSSATAWLLTIFFIPIVGVALFFLVGNYKLSKKRRQKQEHINRFILDNTKRVEEAHPINPPWLDSVAQLNRNLGALPLVGKNSVDFFTEYDESLQEMTDQIHKAQVYVHVEFYILTYDNTTSIFFDALEQAFARGVKVRVLLDHIASMRIKHYKDTLRRLDRMGVEWHLMLPVQPLKGKYQRPDLRNHRKIMIVDGKVAFTGSQNIIDAQYHKRSNLRRGLVWKELMLRLEGPVVAAMNTVFIADWYSETDELLSQDYIGEFFVEPCGDLDVQVVPSGPGFEDENNLRLFLALLYYAQEKIILTSPYFVPDEAMMMAITTATRRGVVVELFVSEIGDQALVYHAQRSYYENLLRAGVRIWMYKAPYILHAKHFTIDDDVAVIGSSNMDMRSFQLNMEVSLMVRGKEPVRSLRRIEEQYRKNSRELCLEELLEQSLFARVVQNLARLTSAFQ